MLRHFAGPLAGAFAGLMLAVSPLAAAPSAAELFFETPFLAKVEPGTRLRYDYRHRTAEAKLGDSFDETMQMSIDAAPDDGAKRVVDVDILRGDIHNEAGPFSGVSGNPLTLVLLERDVKEMAALSKGSPFYLRNRVRDAIGTGASEPARFDYAGRTVDGWTVVLTPFLNDPNKDKLGELVGKRYEFTFSDAVPGGLYAIRVVTPKAEGAPPLIETSVTLTGSTPPAAK
ncbi:MAG TPA: hypothetical protein VLA00_17525 [Xanthobacteraceae bacterium]|nr:hypothetical protein [Xanthobacteraceae bacterium]